MLTNPGDLNELAHDIIGGAMRVHQVAGGTLESTCAMCLQIELTLRGHRIQRNVPVPLVYRGTRIEHAYFHDMLVDDRVVVELKCVDKLLFVHRAQLSRTSASRRSLWGCSSTSTSRCSRTGSGGSSTQIA